MTSLQHASLHHFLSAPTVSPIRPALIYLTSPIDDATYRTRYLEPLLAAQSRPEQRSVIGTLLKRYRPGLASLADLTAPSYN